VRHPGHPLPSLNSSGNGYHNPISKSGVEQIEPLGGGECCRVRSCRRCRAGTICARVNADGAAVLATACLEQEIGLVTFSSDLVFDGNRAAPYLESDAVTAECIRA